MVAVGALPAAGARLGRPALYGGPTPSLAPTWCRRRELLSSALAIAALVTIVWASILAAPEAPP
jgi:hypothetical protein